ncbi:MAG: DNA-3-methyladenine glycosylase [Planctomycetaceae bacterium]
MSENQKTTRKRSADQQNRPHTVFENPDLPPLKVAFFDRCPVQVAQDIVGKWLWRSLGDVCVAGRIVEAEAYLANADAASHAAKGQNQKNAAMFGPPGHAYVYTIHSRQCFNVVTQGAGIGSAVLIRAVEPVFNVPQMQTWRQAAALRRKPTGQVKSPEAFPEFSLRDIARGPARLCEAMHIGRDCNLLPLSPASGLWLTSAGDDLPVQVGISARIGVTQAKEMPLRFFAKDSPFVSGPRWLNQ